MIAGVPYDAEVEYLKSTGTQYIDTNYAFLDNFSYEIDCSRPQTDSTVLGGRTSNIRTAVLYYDSSYGMCVTIAELNSASTPFRTGIIAANERHVFKFNVADNVGTLWLDGNEIKSSSFSGQYTSGVYCAIFADNFGTSIREYTKCKLYSLKMNQSGTLVRDFIPVRFTNELGQTEGALYDRVTKKLFRNQGTGSFVIGPDVAVPVMGLHFMKPKKYTAKDYVQDGLVAMWDGIENAGWGQHDPNATVWKDLIGELDLTFSLDCVIEQDGVLFGASKGVAIIQDKNISPYDVEFVLQRTETSRTYSVFWYDATDYTLGNSQSTYAIGFKNLSFGQGNGYFLSPGNGDELFAIHYHKYPIPRTAYVNGSSATSTSENEAWTPFGKAVCIGGRAPGHSNNFVGRVKSVRAYSRALTADEIAANYAVDKARFNLPEVTA